MTRSIYAELFTHARVERLSAKVTIIIGKRAIRNVASAMPMLLVAVVSSLHAAGAANSGDPCVCIRRERARTMRRRAGCCPDRATYIDRVPATREHCTAQATHNDSGGEPHKRREQPLQPLLPLSSVHGWQLRKMQRALRLYAPLQLLAAAAALCATIH